jgi:hypothetical protein
LIGDQGRLQDSEGVVRSRERRRQDGFFGMTPTGPKNTRVGAILFVRKLTPRSSWRWLSFTIPSPSSHYRGAYSQ